MNKIIMTFVIVVIGLTMCSCKTSNTKNLAYEPTEEEFYVKCSYFGLNIGDEIKDYQKLFDSYYTSASAPDFIIRDVDGGVEIVKYIGNSHKIVIPETIDGKAVVSISCYVHLNSDLTEPDVNNYVWDTDSFVAECKFDIDEIYVSKNVKRIDSNSFNRIYGHQDYIDAEIIYYNLKKVVVDKNNPYYTVENNTLYTKDKSILLYNLNYDDISALNVCKECKKIAESLEYLMKTVKGYKGTVAETFAKENRLEFIALD